MLLLVGGIREGGGAERQQQVAEPRDGDDSAMKRRRFVGRLSKPIEKILDTICKEEILDLCGPAPLPRPATHSKCHLTKPPTEDTAHLSQWAKKSRSLAIFFPLNHAEETEAAVKVAKSRKIVE